MMASAAVGVPTMALPELLDIRNASDADTMISGLQLDSRKVRPGDLFLALPGDVHDGRQFIEQAVANGAAAVAAEAPVAGFLDAITVPWVELPDLRFELGALAARFYRNPSSQQHVTGVTGTNGKTTTSRIIGQLTRALGKPCGVIGTRWARLFAMTLPQLATQRRMRFLCSSSWRTGWNKACSQSLWRYRRMRWRRDA